MIDDFFKEYNVDNSWIIGNIAADASITKTRNRVEFDIKRDDRIILEYIKGATGSHHKIRDVDRYDKRTGNTYKKSILQICSSSYKEDLQKLGLTPNKTKLGVPFPSFLPSLMMRHYLRGYFDGDGSIYRRRNSGEIKIVGDCKFLEDLQNWLWEHGIIQVRKTKIMPDKSTYQWQMCRRENVARIADFMYSEGGFYLPRKKERFIEYGLLDISD